MSGPRHLSASEAAALVRDVDTVGFPLGPGQPGAFLHALGERESYEDLQLFGALLVDLYEVFGRPGVRYFSGFYGPAERLLLQAGGSIEFVPADFRRFAPILQSMRPRVMCTVAAPPDAAGYCSLSLHAGASVDELHRAGHDDDRLLVVEVSEHFPRTLGIAPTWPHAIHVDEIDVLVESDRTPFVLGEDEPDDVARAIAESASQYIGDGATLQTGIGAIPSAVASLLANGPGGDYGVHSEMFTTGLMHLHKAGKVSNLRKGGVFDGHSVTTFAAGSPELYEWLDGNEEVRFLPVDVVNSPELIAKNRHMVTINGAVAVDVFGQVVADTVGGRQFSGIGGHEDFVSGPGLALEDRSLVCMPATARVGDELVSRLVPSFPAGAVITTPRHQLDVIITEFGAAELQGRTVRQRAEALASVAHPQFRDALLEHARTADLG
jgi:acyl-CoA hydrolase